MSKTPISAKNEKSVRQRRVMRQTGADAWQDTFRGTGVIYVLTPDEPASLSFTVASDVLGGDYCIDALETSWPEQQRAVRQEHRRKRLPINALPRESLGDKLLIACGPELSAASVVAALEHIIDSIKRNGLLTGEDSRGTMVSEAVEQPSPLLDHSR